MYPMDGQDSIMPVMRLTIRFGQHNIYALFGRYKIYRLSDT